MTNPDGVSALVAELRKPNQGYPVTDIQGLFAHYNDLLKRAADALSRSPSVRVDDEMVERACRAVWDAEHHSDWDLRPKTPYVRADMDRRRNFTRIALQAALTKATP